MKPATLVRWCGGLLILAAFSARADVNSWINPTSGNWEDALSWSLGVPPGSSQSVMITNAGWKAVVINSSTPINFPNSMTVGDLTIAGPTNTENTLLLNFSGTTTPLQVLNDCNIATNGHVLMLYSAMDVGNAFNLNGVFDQEGGELIFTNSLTNTLQIEGGQFNLTNGVVNGENMYLGGVSDGFVTQNSGLVSLGWLGLGEKPSLPGSTNSGTYVLQNGWLMATNIEDVGESGFGTLNQTGGTNSPNTLFVAYGTYSKTDGGLFAGEVRVIGGGTIYSPPNGLMTQSGGTAIITNNLTVEGGGNRHAPQGASFDMFGGSLSAWQIILAEAAGFNQTNGTVNVANELFIDDGGGNLASVYTLNGGNLFTSAATVESSWPEESEIAQSGGANVVTNTLWINGTAVYYLTGGTVSASNIVLSGNINNPPQFFVNGAPSSAVANETFTLEGGSVVIENSTQQFGSLTLVNDSGINFAGGSATLRFADSRVNNWQGELTTPPQLLVYNWNGSTSGGGQDQLIFGVSSSALIASQVAQIQFSNPVGLPSGTYSARILSNGEVVPDLGSTTPGPVNSWINPTSGSWEDAASWSLGIPPGAGQTILVTNHGWKAVAIANNTTANFPQTMSIDALSVISPGTDTVNTVLLNFAGTQTPLMIARSLEISTNTAMVILQSAVEMTNGNFEIDGGAVTEDAFSQVSAQNLQLTNGGIYNLTNGTITLPFAGAYANDTAETIASGSLFNQAGGSNYCFGLYDSGEYDIFKGNLVVPGYELSGGVQVLNGTFVQYGGTVNVSLAIGKFGGWGGTYELLGGTLSTPSLLMPMGPPSGNPGGACLLVQGGGTNYVHYMNVGAIGGGVISTPVSTSAYTLSNGSLVSTNIDISGLGSINQTGGIHSNQSLSLSESVFFQQQQPGEDSYLTTNYGYYTLNGGTFVSDLVNAQPGNFSQSAGTCQITSLQMGGGQYSLLGGQLTASSITLSNASFLQSGGTVAQSGTLTLAGARVSVGPGPQQFGDLELGTGANTNSTLTLPPGAATVHFANSSGLAWSSGALLIISNWQGSLSGNGSQQIVFGNDSTGLTHQQLSQVQFVNPAGLPGGSYSARILSTGEAVPDPASPTSGPVNSWITAGSGNWDQASNWSLNALPDRSQSVVITNNGSKTVAINSTTPNGFASSMTVTNLLIEGGTNEVNTLLLNNFGTNLPLTVLNGLTLQNGGQILNFNSGLAVQGGTFMISNSDVIQDGGFIRATNGQTYLSDSQYYLTNGVFAAATVSLGYPISSHFNQYGGAVIITNLGFASYVLGTNVNGYSLYGGTLDVPGGMNLTGEAGGAGYFQSGGTNRTGQVTIEPDYGGFISGFTLNGGLLADSGVTLMAGYETAMAIGQNSGSHVITNTLFIAGYLSHGYSVDPATYNLNGGMLSAGVIELAADNGDSVFVQSNATTSAGTVYAHSLGYYGLNNSIVTLAGGTLSCSNYTTIDGGAQLNQSGGALVVSNLLDFGGSRDVGGPTAIIYGRYTFTGGTVTASNINLTGDWIIGDGSTNRISNPGYFSLGHRVQIGNAVEQLGRFILASNAIIDLAGSASRLSFASSGNETWNSSAQLMISNWNGSATGGGGEQLKFGNSAAGLTVSQLNQVRFVNPVGFAAGTYDAQILSTGEIVPAARPSLGQVRQGNKLVLSWPPGWTLQTATNVLGPYFDMPSATSPYTNDATANPQGYFRLKQ